MSSLKKHIDLSRFVALGDSVTTGFKDGALFYEAQLNSFPNLLACQFGCKFQQPLVDPNSVGIGFFENSRLVLKEQAGSAGMQLSYLAAQGDSSALSKNCYATQGPFNNLGVPGAKAITLIAPGYGNGKLGEGNYNPFFARFCSDPEKASMLDEAMALNPTFFSLFIGSNDVLAYALSGGTTDAITPVEGPPGIGFEASMRHIINTLISKGAKGAIANLPAITSIPFFNTIHYNDLVLNSASAELLNSKYHSAGVKLLAGRNSFLVEDLSCAGGVRQIVNGELISIDIMLDENKLDYLKGLKPIPKKYYLSQKQIAEVHGAIISYNAIIKKIAIENDLAFVDTHQVLQNTKADRIYDVESREIKYKTGGFFSLDGLHINSLGHALLANEFITAINQTYGTELAKINLTKSREHYQYITKGAIKGSLESQTKRSKVKTIRRAHLPKMPFHNIAISLSGGGYRATCTHLGILSYMSSVKLYNVSLLERVRVLSSASAGTFVGVKYVSTLKKGGTFEDCYKSLLDFMTKVDLVEDALQHLSDDRNWNETRHRSLINAFSSIYFKTFESETFGLLWQENPPIHLKEISFNATEFNFALPFHFRKTELSQLKTISIPHDHTGNRKIHIPLEVAKEIRLADIIAASSCFPFGFEPINFPDDFIYAEAVKLKDRSLLPARALDGEKIEYPIGLMDGGVDDNQGVDSIISAEERMRHYPEELHEFRSHDRKAIDLYILSDGTNPTMESYTRSKRDKLKYVGKWSFKLLRNFGIVSSILGLTAIVYACYLESRTLIILLAISGTLGILLALALLIFSRGIVGLSKRVGVPPFFLKRLLHVDKLRFATLNNLLVNRRNSVTKMITKVFIKQMRWFSFERVYSDDRWRLRLVMNAVSELTGDEVEKRRNKYPFLSDELLNPGETTKVSEKSLQMGTTLWFTPEELQGEKNMPNTIIACGQYTICFNLIKYFEKYLYHPRYKKDYEKYTPEMKEELARLYSKLMSDWIKFKVNPYWMVQELNKKCGV